MKIRFNQPKYVIPLIIFPFTFLGFYVYQDLFVREKAPVLGNDGLQQNLSQPSQEVVRRNLNDKLAAYQQRYREADGYTAIGEISPEKEQSEGFDELYSDKEKARLDSLSLALKARQKQQQDPVDETLPGNSVDDWQDAESLPESDRLLLEMLNKPPSASPDLAVKARGEKEDPLKLMRQQYALLDSFQKANDPDYRAQLQQQEAKQAREQQLRSQQEASLPVSRPGLGASAFHTIRARKDEDFIKAIVDEELVGFAGSRVRIRLLEPIVVGEQLLPKGCLLYALISGFGAQRVQLQISSVTFENQILPVSLSVYDLDGMKGLYVPASAFRDFSKELGSNSVQGVNISASSEDAQSQFLMSGIQKAFQSSSQAVSKAIRKNKVRLKYSTLVYLIDEKQFRVTKNPNQNEKND